MRKLLPLTAAAFCLLALAGCTSTNTSQPKPSAPMCDAQAPTVPSTVKAGATLKVKGPSAANCTTKFSSKNRLVNLSLKDSHGLVLASSSTQAEADGSYAATFAVPSLVSGKATVTLESGIRRTCKASACKPLTAPLTIQKRTNSK
jgi:hypothetical protein